MIGLDWENLEQIIIFHLPKDENIIICHVSIERSSNNNTLYFRIFSFKPSRIGIYPVSLFSKHLFTMVNSLCAMHGPQMLFVMWKITMEIRCMKHSDREYFERFWTIFGCFSLQTCSTSFSQAMVVDLLFFSIRFFICFYRDLPKVCHNISEMDSWSEFVWNLCSDEIKPRITFFRSKARKNHTNHLKKKKVERKSVCTFIL